MIIIPIGHEEQKVTRLPWVTIALIVANVAVFLLTNSIAERQSLAIRAQVRDVVLFAREHPYLRMPAELARVVPPKQPPADLPVATLAEEQARFDYLFQALQRMTAGTIIRTYGYIPSHPNLLTLITTMFMHGGWLHLIGNMLFLWLAGGSLEDRWGRLVFPILYLASGVVATLTHAAMDPQSAAPLVGASGAIAGLMGAFLIRLATTRIKFFYWIYFFRGTFLAPAYVVLPFWLLQQVFMVSRGQAGNVAVWAHIGGFAFGLAVALVVQWTGFEKKFLAPAIQKKTSWVAPERLTAALAHLDKGKTDQAIAELQAILKAKADSVEARAALLTAYTQKGDQNAAAKESARLVGTYLRARDVEGALAAAKEHASAYRETPLFLRDALTLAAYHEKQGQSAEAADLYGGAIDAWPEDPLAPKALVAYGRLMLQVFNAPDRALELLERARAHPKVTPEFQKASEDLLKEIQGTQPPAEPPPPEHTLPPVPEPEPALEAPAVSAAPPEAPVIEMPEEPIVLEVADLEEAPAPPPPPRITRKLAPIPARAVAMDSRGLHLQDQGGKTGLIPWQGITGLSTARIGDAASAAQAVDDLLLDLLLDTKTTPESTLIRCIRLSSQDLAIPQLQGEASPVRGFQRFVATVLKAAGATPYPSRDECLGARGFPTFPDLATYEAALLASLPAA